MLRFDDRVRLARASELATRGHLLEAEALLCPGLQLPSSPVELDLLARIHVQQGQYAQAQRRWEDALKISEQRDEYEECIKVMNNWLESRQQTLIWQIRLGLIAVAIILSFWVLCRLGLFSHI